MYQCPCHIWYLGIWYLDILVSWNLDILVSWYLGTCTCSHKWALGKHWSDCHLEISCRLLVLKTCLRTKTDLEYHCRQLWMKPSGIRTVEFHSTHLSYVMISRTHFGPIIPDLCLPWWAIQNSMPVIIVNRINPAWPVERVERVLSDPFQTWRWWWGQHGCWRWWGQRGCSQGWWRGWEGRFWPWWVICQLIFCLKRSMQIFVKLK